MRDADPCELCKQSTVRTTERSVNDDCARCSWPYTSQKTSSGATPTLNDGIRNFGWRR